MSSPAYSEARSGEAVTWAALGGRDLQTAFPALLLPSPAPQWVLHIHAFKLHEERSGEESDREGGAHTEQAVAAWPC